ncbi:hypothetical protein, partial [Kaarinaea lacus]
MIRYIVKATLLGVLIISAVSQTWAKEPPKMKMTTPIPEGIETPTKLETHLGTLTSFDGVPDKQTTQKVYDDLDLRRATEAFLAALPIASMSAMEAGLRKFGPPNTTAILFEDLMDSKS